MKALEWQVLLFFIMDGCWLRAGTGTGTGSHASRSLKETAEVDEQQDGIGAAQGGRYAPPAPCRQLAGRGNRGCRQRRAHSCSVLQCSRDVQCIYWPPCCGACIFTQEGAGSGSVNGEAHAKLTRGSV